MKPKPSGGGALRAKEIWLLKQPRSGARVRLDGLFVCDRKTQEELKMKLNVKKLVVSGMLTFFPPLNQKNVEFFPGHFPTIIKLQRNETEEK